MLNRKPAVCAVQRDKHAGTLRQFRCRLNTNIADWQSFGGDFSLFQSFANPRWFTPPIKHGMNGNHFFSQRVVDGEGKTFGEQAMIRAKTDAMNAGVQVQRVNVRNQGIEKIGAKPRTLFLVKLAPFLQIPLGFIKDANPHEDGRDSLALAASQSENLAWPEAVRSARSWSTTPCHSGEAT